MFMSASSCSALTRSISVAMSGDISVADINDDDIDFDEEISFLPDSQSQRGLDFETVLVQVNSQEKKPTIEDDGCAGRLVQAVDEAISRSRSAVAACASNQNSFEDTAAVRVFKDLYCLAGSYWLGWQIRHHFKRL